VSKRPPARSAARPPPASPAPDVPSVLAALRRLATRRTLEGMARYGIPSVKAFGVSVSDMQRLAKRLGRDHDLAAALWKTGWYEARMLTAFLDDPTLVTPAQMERWARDFDNWAICDTLCFKLFDRAPQAWKMVAPWSRRREEFVKRAAFALLASLALHDRRAGDAAFLRCLPLVERAAADERNFVKKGVSWALRAVGQRNRVLHAAAVATARRLAESPGTAARWVGKDALRDLLRPKVLQRLAARQRTAKT